MKKRVFASIAVALISAMLFSGCVLYGNDRSETMLMTVEERDGRTVFYLPTEKLVYDGAEGTLGLKEGDDGETHPAVVLNGDSFPNRVFKVEEGYEELLTHVFTFAIDPESPYVHALAWEQDGLVYGFCNVYGRATGFLSGGGQIDTKHIVRAVLFTYEKETDTVTVKEELEKCVVVAYDGENVVYFRDREYFSKSDGRDPVKICEDEAFDSGMTSYSYARFYFGGGYCILFFHHGESNYKKDYDLYVLITMEGEVLAELRITDLY